MVRKWVSGVRTDPPGQSGLADGSARDDRVLRRGFVQRAGAGRMDPGHRRGDCGSDPGGREGERSSRPPAGVATLDRGLDTVRVWARARCHASADLSCSRRAAFFGRLRFLARGTPALAEAHQREPRFPERGALRTDRSRRRSLAMESPKHDRDRGCGVLDLRCRDHPARATNPGEGLRKRRHDRQLPGPRARLGRGVAGEAARRADMTVPDAMASAHREPACHSSLALQFTRYAGSI